MSYLLALLALLGVGAPHAQGCTCSAPPPAEARAAADVILAGRAVDVAEMAAGWEDARFDVYTVWKGDPQEAIVIRTGGPQPACAVDFRARRDYLVYATEQNGVLMTDRCMATQPLETASSHVIALGEGTSFSALPGTTQIPHTLPLFLLAGLVIAIVAVVVVRRSAA